MSENAVDVAVADTVVLVVAAAAVAAVAVAGSVALVVVAAAVAAVSVADSVALVVVVAAAGIAGIAGIAVVGGMIVDTAADTVAERVGPETAGTAADNVGVMMSSPVSDR